MKLECLCSQIYRVVDQKRGQPLGTAFSITGETYVTAAHVLEGMRANEVTLDQGHSERGHAKILKIECFRELAFAKTDSVSLERLRCDVRDAVWGEDVYVIGYPIPENPEAWKLDVEIRICGSIIMAKIQERRLGMLEIQGPFPKGFSGAPVLGRSDGALLGLLDAVGYSKLDCNALFALGFVIPSRTIFGGQNGGT